MSRSNACIFIGRRRISRKFIWVVVRRMSRAIDMLAANGVTEFISFGKNGFDLLAAALVLAKRETGTPVCLTVVRPRTDLFRLSLDPRRKLLGKVLNDADRVIYTTGKINKRSFDSASVCLCYMPGKIGPLNRRLLKNRFVINVAYKV